MPERVTCYAVVRVIDLGVYCIFRSVFRQRWVVLDPVPDAHRLHADANLSVRDFSTF